MPESQATAKPQRDMIKMPSGLLTNTASTGISDMAARIRRIVHDDNTRAKIQTSQIINRLTDHMLGTIELSATQIQAARILLDRTLPVLSAINHTGELTHNVNATDISDNELAAIIATTGSKRTTKPKDSEAKLH